jgi:uncharacterized protein YjiS (DUF1127 family)
MATPKPRTETVRRSSVVRWVKGLVVMWQHWRDVELVANFDDHMLADIGLTRADLHDAMAEPRWRDPTMLLDLRRHERLASRHEVVSKLTHQVVDGSPRRLCGCRPPVASPLLTR